MIQYLKYGEHSEPNAPELIIVRTHQHSHKNISCLLGYDIVNFSDQIYFELNEFFEKIPIAPYPDRRSNFIPVNPNFIPDRHKSKLIKSKQNEMNTGSHTLAFVFEFI